MTPSDDKQDGKPTENRYTFDPITENLVNKWEENLSVAYEFRDGDLTLLRLAVSEALFAAQAKGEEIGEKKYLYENNRLRGEIACATDLANTWARETSVEECRNPYGDLNLRALIDRLWLMFACRDRDWRERLTRLKPKAEYKGDKQ